MTRQMSLRPLHVRPQSGGCGACRFSKSLKQADVGTDVFLGCGFTALLCETVRTVGIANLLQSPHSVPELNMAGANASDKRAQLHRDLRHARQARRRFAASVQSQLAAGPHNDMGPAGFSHPKQGLGF